MKRSLLLFMVFCACAYFCKAQKQYEFQTIIMESIENCMDSMRCTMKHIDPYHILYKDTNVYVTMLCFNDWKQGISRPVKVIDFSKGIVCNVAFQDSIYKVDEIHRMNFEKKIMAVSLKSIDLFSDTLVIRVVGSELERVINRLRKRTSSAYFANGVYKYVFSKPKEKWILVEQKYTPYSY